MNTVIPEYVELPDDVKFPDVLVEEVCPLLSELMRFFEKWSPESFPGFYLSCGIALISIVSARRVEVLFGERRATSLFIILVDTSGMSAKTTVLKLVQKVLKATGLDFLLLPDNITASKLFSSMSIKVPEGFNELSADERKKVIESFQKKKAFTGQRGWIYDEFGKLMREMMQSKHHNSSFRELLKKLFDNNDQLSKSTQIRDGENIIFPFLTLLGGMTPNDLSPHAQSGSTLWGDGFFPRFVFICPPVDFRRDGRFPKGEIIVPESIIKQLKDWHNRLGVPEIKLSPEVEVLPAPGQLFEISDEIEDAIYAYRYALKDIIDDFDNSDLKGSYLRFSEIALRIAALITSLNNQSQITLDIWALAQKITEQWRKDLHKLYYLKLQKNHGSKNTSIQDPVEKIVDLLSIKGELTRRELSSLTHYKKETLIPLLDILLRKEIIREIPCGKTVKYSIINSSEV